MRKIMIFLIICSLVNLTACTTLGKATPDSPVVAADQEQAAKLILEGHLVPKSEILINAMVNGRVNDILVSEEQILEKGTRILIIDGIEKVTAQIDAAQLEYLKAQKDLDDLTRTADITSLIAQSNLAQGELDFIEAQSAYEIFDSIAYQEKIDQSKTDIEKAEDEVNKAKDDLKPYKDLDEDNQLRKKFEEILSEKQAKLDDLIRIRDSLISSKDLAKTKLDIAEKSLIEARYQSDQKQDGPDKKLLNLTNAKLISSKSNLNANLSLTQYYQIDSPMQGVVAQILVQEGDFVMVGQPIMRIIDNSDWYIETIDLTELDIKNVSIGEKVILTPDAFPDLDIEGELEKISQWFYEQGGDIHYQGRIKVLENHPEFRWGMTFEITIP